MSCASACLRHSPGILVATLTAPVTMTVLFGYVFGSAIAVPERRAGR